MKSKEMKKEIRDIAEIIDEGTHCTFMEMGVYRELPRSEENNIRLDERKKVISAFRTMK
jgi:hypothetical protein